MQDDVPIGECSCGAYGELRYGYCAFCLARHEREVNRYGRVVTVGLVFAIVFAIVTIWWFR